VSELVLVEGVFVLAFVSAFVPLVSIELALVGAAATGTSGRLLVARVLLAATGQMVGKSCFFLGGRTAFARSTRRKRQGRLRSAQWSERLVARAARQRGVAAAVTVFVSAVTGLPPFALVSALAGAWRLRLPSFFVLGLVGRSARFAGVLLVPHVPGW
jgi:membrane protein YqaA with SNARE-associated domain